MILPLLLIETVGGAKERQMQGRGRTQARSLVQQGLWATWERWIRGMGRPKGDMDSQKKKEGG